MTFTIGKHRMRNGEEAEVVSTAGREPYVLLGYIHGAPEGNVGCWTADGRWKLEVIAHNRDLLPPSPPKLDTRTPLTLLELSGLVTDACLSLDGIGQDHAAARLALRRLHDAIHKRVTEQVED